MSQTIKAISGVEITFRVNFKYNANTEYIEAIIKRDAGSTFQFNETDYWVWVCPVPTDSFTTSGQVEP